ncbi:hypothetical protein GCM10008955_36740 [Deinococcus malanensis]|uniref:Uncharacterized protein n=1 Tax=Deinococcus malanensis TaxID=1706855 RepID=A0ABQ2F4E6_9DEIO|nr:hypothetical protein [Deinococcus malanensis]GGK39564.1 hypothetical protein GCM10008955_36740 [Deinococcus malanensis]
MFRLGILSLVLLLAACGRTTTPQITTPPPTDHYATVSFPESQREFTGAR